jgi:hypothetical protein
MAKVEKELRAFVTVLENLDTEAMSEQDAIALLVKSGYSDNAEQAKLAIMGIREMIFAGSLPPDSEICI